MKIAETNDGDILFKCPHCDKPIYVMKKYVIGVGEK